MSETKPISKMLVKELKEELSKRGLDTKGLKAELAERLEKAVAEDTKSHDAEHEKRVEAGLVGALSNENTSDAAKEKINEKLEQLHTEGKVEDVKPTEEEKHQHRVEGGLKAALTNDNTTEEGKAAAQEKLDMMEVTGEVAEKKDLTEEEKHLHQVEGGLKAALTNEKTSEEAKVAVQEKLDILQTTGELPEVNKHHVDGVPEEKTDYSAKEEPEVPESEKPAGVEEPVAQLSENRDKEMVVSNVDNAPKSEEAKQGAVEIDETAKLSKVLKMRDPTIAPLSRTVAPVSNTVEAEDSKKRKTDEEQMGAEKKSRTETSDQPSAVSSN